MQCNMALSQARAQTIDLYVNNIHHLFAGDLMENDHFINTVDKLWAEALFTQFLANHVLNIVLIHAIKLVQPCSTHVTGHDDHGIFKINCATLPSRQSTIVEYL